MVKSPSKGETNVDKTKLSELSSAYGCLRNQRTRQSDAKRRNAEDRGENWLFLSHSPFAIDADQKLLPSKAVRRLGDKTQVVTRFLPTDSPNRHIRTRRIHTDDVVGVATAISGILGLNNDLCRAIAIGHDIGHVPFGHSGEAFLSKITGRKFRHEVFGVIIAQKIERSSNGLNLTKQVLEGILHHSRGVNELKISSSTTAEANVAMCADKIAYTWSDINDIFIANRVGFELKNFSRLNKEINWFGNSQRERIHCCIKELCIESAGKNQISFTESEAAQRFAEIKKLMYEVYPLANCDSINESDLIKVYEFLKHTVKGVDPAITYALLCDSEVFYLMHKDKLEENDINHLSISEITKHLRDKEIDFTNPDLNW